ncbi:hypothetical protein DSO57_1004769 [Entomophthora muscae]|uniref:Uncharacterized protein n=1 Tax=Entomophthora muscae TaxID=34485 RepID=A0ACC2UHZ9_9FUNG|nr:hypothetical protein DSO57_1004769 [Entomophthora muscae]
MLFTSTLYLSRSRIPIAKGRPATRCFSMVFHLFPPSPSLRSLHCPSSAPASIDFIPMADTKVIPYQRNTRTIPYNTAMKILNDKALRKLSKKIEKYHRIDLIPSANTLRKILFIAILENEDLVSLQLPTEKYLPIIHSCQAFFLKDIRNSPYRARNSTITKFLISLEPLKQHSSSVNKMPLEDEEFDDDFEFEVHYTKEKEKDDPIRKLFGQLSRVEVDRNCRVILIGYFIELFFSRNDILLLKRIYSQYLFSFRNTDSKLFFLGIKRLVKASLKIEPSFSIVLVARVVSAGKTSADRKSLKSTFIGMVHHFSDKNDPTQRAFLFRFFEIISLHENIKPVSLLLSECERASQILYQSVIKHIAEHEPHNILAMVTTLLDLSNQEAWPPLSYVTYSVAMNAAFSAAFKEGISSEERDTGYKAAIEIFELARDNNELHSYLLMTYLFAMSKADSWDLALQTFLELPNLRSLEVYRAVFHGCIKHKVSRENILKLLGEFKQANLESDLPVYTMMLQLLFQAHLLPELLKAYGAIQSQSGAQGSLGPLNKESYASGQLKMDGHLAAVLYKALTRVPWNNMASDAFCSKMIEDIDTALKSSTDSDNIIVLTARLAFYQKLCQNANALSVVLQLMQSSKPMDQGAHSAIMISLSRFNDEEISRLYSLLNPPSARRPLGRVSWFNHPLSHPNTQASIPPAIKEEAMHKSPNHDERKANIMEILTEIKQRPHQRSSIVSKALLASDTQ